MAKNLNPAIQACIIFLAIAALSSSVIHFITVVNAPALSGQNNAPAEQENGSNSAIETVSNAHLFGSHEDMREESQSDLDKLINDALELKGISNESGEPEYTGAYIAEKGQAEVFYRIGDALPSGLGIVDEVTPDYITIKKDGRKGRLHFPKQDNIIQDVPPQ
jgi:type II secretory pathway component PulC